MSVDYPRTTRERDIKNFIEKAINGAKRPHDIAIYENLITWLTGKIFDAAYEMGERKYVAKRKEPKSCVCVVSEKCLYHQGLEKEKGEH